MFRENQDVRTKHYSLFTITKKTNLSFSNRYLSLDIKTLFRQSGLLHSLSMNRTKSAEIVVSSLLTPERWRR